MRNETAPVTGVEMSRRLKVTRQIIVGDVALLRSAGRPIMATARGYILGRPGRTEGMQPTVCLPGQDPGGKGTA
ncbi:HTH domain-containing protein, partial [Acidaminococcus timonensis]|uniref:HTH domain-containing protein n=1 Tax=Acidaminococcus timonensis TaxID=1871002 RepID=UPI003C6CD730